MLATNYARRRVARNKTLVPSGAITQEEFDLQEAELLQAQADVEGAKAGIASSQAAIATANRRRGSCRGSRGKRGIES